MIKQHLKNQKNNHNPHSELSNIYDRHFKLREISTNTYFRLIPSGNLGLFDYNRGLCWIKLQTLLHPKSKYRSISVIIGNIDDGLWRAETTEIESSIDVDRYLKQLCKVIDNMDKLASSDKLSEMLSIPVNPYLLHGEFE